MSPHKTSMHAQISTCPFVYTAMGEVSTTAEQISEGAGGGELIHPRLPCSPFNHATARGATVAEEMALTHLGSAWRWSCCLTYQRKWC